MYGFEGRDEPTDEEGNGCLLCDVDRAERQTAT